MRLDNLLSMSWKELSKMSTKDLSKIADHLTNVANSRLEKIESAGLSEWSPAYQGVQRSGKNRLSSGGTTNRNKIKSQIVTARDFIQNKTSTVQGIERYKGKIDELMGTGKPKPKRGRPRKERHSPTPEPEKRKRGRPRKEKPPEESTEMQRKKLFRALDKLREKDQTKVFNVGSPQIIKELRKIQSRDRRISADKLVEELEKKYPELLEDSEAQYEREVYERENRTDADFEFHPLSPAEERNNPFKS